MSNDRVQIFKRLVHVLYPGGPSNVFFVFCLRFVLVCIEKRENRVFYLLSLRFVHIFIEIG